MKKSSFDVTLGQFYLDMAWDIDFLVKIENARQVVRTKREKRDVFEAYVFRICAYWEELVETLFIDCLNRDTSKYKETTGFRIPKDLSREICTAAVLGTGYFDWKSIDNLKRMAKDMLVPKFNPFKEIPKPRGDKVDEFFRIRNYLAHRSDKARRSLKKVYDKYGFKTFRQPGEFLSAEDKKNKIPRMGVYINNFRDIVTIMGRFLNVRFLSDVDIEDI